LIEIQQTDTPWLSEPTALSAQLDCTCTSLDAARMRDAKQENYGVSRRENKNPISLIESSST